MNAPAPGHALAMNVAPVSHLDLPGAGQVYVAGNYAYVGHITNKEGLGTSILDVSDPRKPRLVSQIPVGDPDSHSHKARVVGDVMIVNMEQNMTAIGRKADELPKLRTALRAELGRDATHAELAAKLGVKESDIPAVEAAEKKPYAQGGFKVYDVSDRAKPKLITHHRTHGRGVHRFDMDADYAYISTEMPGYVGNILVNYDIRNPAKPEEVSRWWLPGQHVAGGEKPTWPGRQHRLHHALRMGDRMWAGCWHGGVRVIDATDIRKPRTIGEYNYHPPFPEPSHTFMGLKQRIGGRQIAIAIDEEDHAHSAEEMAKRRGRPHAGLWVFDVTELPQIQPLAIYEVSELDSPWSRAAPGRFGAHQFQEHWKGGDTLVYCAWFAGGLRIVDIADPLAPREAGYYIPQPAPGKVAPQTNDVDVDERGLIYIVDRYTGFDILEFDRK
ncbi:MAG: RNA polymerase subunit sigma-70 [Betaproteobacteria bacterium]|nr:RNA polymerase subunit sigma-70 [Betaproteobacteria bacterium]